VAVKAVVFDVGETLIDETRLWERAADGAGAPRFTVMGIVGGLAARGDDHQRVWELLGIEPVRASWTPANAEYLLRDHVDVVGSSTRWEVAKPARAFFERIVAECGVGADEVAYVGDRVDNDIEPALAAGMVAVHIRRGPWGHLHDPPEAALHVSSLDELPAVLGV
jgi:FMN phosphatase YigB (HAD superfamily)